MTDQPASSAVVASFAGTSAFAASGAGPEIAASAADRALLERLDAIAGDQRSWPVDGTESWSVRAAVGLCAPLWISLALLAALTRAARGRRPVFVVQERVGYRRRRLWLPKIATMSLPSNRRVWGGLVELSPEAGIDPTPIAPVERWLRNTGLDELPQLALVVSGHMRIVGPRPATFGELEQLVHSTTPDSAATIGVDVLAPGIVGVWQILDRHRYSLAERMALDRFMIDRWSPELARTVVLVAATQAVRRLLGRS